MKGVLLAVIGYGIAFGNYTVKHENMHYVEEAFSGFSGSYYQITINDFTTKPKYKRSWKERWDLLSEHIDFTGLRVLDVGCMNGLLPVFAMKYGGAKQGVGIDRAFGDQFAALSKAFEVGAEFLPVNIDKERYIDRITGTDFDIVCCMSVMNWVRRKKYLASFLAKFDKILYEGHETLEAEVARFSKYGFKHKVIGKLYGGSWHKDKYGKSHPGRYVILFYKDP